MKAIMAYFGGSIIMLCVAHLFHNDCVAFVVGFLFGAIIFKICDAIERDSEGVGEAERVAAFRRHKEAEGKALEWARAKGLSLSELYSITGYDYEHFNFDNYGEV